MQWYSVTALATIVVYAASARAAAAPAAKPVTPDSVRQQLAEPDKLAWQQQPLRDGLRRLSQNWDTPIFLDRQVDPDQLVDFLDGQPRHALLAALAQQLGLQMTVVDTVIYIGPPATAEVIASLAETRFDDAQQIRRMTALRKRTRLEWDEATEPRSLLERLAAEQQIVLRGIDAVPHDLWPPGEWPALPVTHQLALLLAGFGLTYELAEDGAGIEIVPLPPAFQLRRAYPVRGNARRVEQLKAQYPQAIFTTRGNTVSVEASAEDHFWIRRQLAGLGAFRPRPSGEKRYQLKSTATFDALARTIAQTLELDLEYDPQVQAVKTRRVELEVRDASREQLLEALVNTAHLRYTINGQLLLIHP